MVRTGSLRTQSARHRVDHGTICGRNCANSGHYKPLRACVHRIFLVELADDLSGCARRHADTVPSACLVTGTKSFTVETSGNSSERVAVVTGGCLFWLVRLRGQPCARARGPRRCNNLPGALPLKRLEFELEKARNGLHSACAPHRRRPIPSRAKFGWRRDGIDGRAPRCAIHQCPVATLDVGPKTAYRRWPRQRSRNIVVVATVDRTESHARNSLPASGIDCAAPVFRRGLLG